MRELGIALLVGGAAFLVSGLIFLVPTRLARSAQQSNVDEGREEIDRICATFAGSGAICRRSALPV